MDRKVHSFNKYKHLLARYNGGGSEESSEQGIVFTFKELDSLVGEIDH